MQRFSDAELVNRRFQYDDPESIPDLCRDRPDPALDPEIVGYYFVRPSGGRAANPQSSYIWCCHCQKATHWDGRVVSDSSARTYIIGADCGRKHYGDRFVAIDRAFDEMIARQRLLERWSRLYNLRDQLLSEIDLVLGDPLLSKIDLRRQQLRRAVPKLVRRLNAIVRRGENLIIRDRVRDVAAEERRLSSYQRARERYKALSKQEQAQARREGFSPFLNEEPLFMNVEEDLGPVRGRHALNDDNDARSQAVKLRDCMLKIIATNLLEKVRNQQLSRVLTDTREASANLHVAIAETALTWEFFDPSNIAKVERWYDSVNHSPCAAESDYAPGAPELISKALAPLEKMNPYYPPTLKVLLTGE